MKITDTRRTNWFWMDNNAIDILSAQLGPYAFAVYAALARMANAHSRKAFPSVATLVRVTKMSRSTVTRAIHALEEHQVIRIEQRLTEEGDLTSNEYTLLDISEWNFQPKSSLTEEEVVSDRDDGSVPQTPRVMSHRHHGSCPTDTLTILRGNNTHVEQYSPNNSKSHSSKPKVLKEPPPEEIKLIQEVILRYPPKDLWPALIQKVKGKTKEQVGACYEAWRLRGYSPTNYAWLEWLETGIPQSNGYGRYQQPKVDTMGIIERMYQEGLEKEDQ